MWTCAGLLALLACAGAVTRDQFYPHGPELDQILPRGGVVPGREVQLQVPIWFYHERYDSVFVNNYGVLTFRADISQFLNIEFPLPYPSIAAFYTNVDTTGDGSVYFRETNEPHVLSKAEESVQNNFHEYYDFKPTSVFIATWIEVPYEASNKLPSYQRNSFQIAVISNGTESFTELLYPEREIQWIQKAPQALSIPEAKAQVGFAAEDGRVFMLRGSGSHQIRNIVAWSNTHEPGKYVFRIGNIPDGGNVALPDQYNQNEVELEEETKTCAQTGPSVCHISAKCVDYQAGICCQCFEGYYGNGKSCIKDDVPLRVHGKINGILNNVNLNDVDIQAYVVVAEGRAYTALSLIPGNLGSSLQLLSVLGGVIGWLFAKPGGSAKNGYQLTGSLFNHTAEVWFPATGDRVTINQEYLGHDVFDQINLETDIRGSLPVVMANTKLEITEYEEQYTLVEPGLIRSESSRTFTNKRTGEKYEQKVTQTFTFSSCHYAPATPEDNTPLTLKVNKNYLAYETRENIVRYGMSNKIFPLGQEDPCIKGRNSCGAHSSCVVQGDSFSCVCQSGFTNIYQGDTVSCIDVDECEAGTHNCDTNAECFNHDGGFQCRCRSGFIGNGINCKALSSCRDKNCDVNARCVEDPNGEATCVCNSGFDGNGQLCYPNYESVCTHCSPYSSCIFTSTGYTCKCRDEYTGDGYNCVPLDDPRLPAVPSPVENNEADYNDTFVLPNCDDYGCSCPQGYSDFRDELNNQLCRSDAVPEPTENHYQGPPNSYYPPPTESYNTPPTDRRYSTETATTEFPEQPPRQPEYPSQNNYPPRQPEYPSQNNYPSGQPEYPSQNNYPPRQPEYPSQNNYPTDYNNPEYWNTPPPSDSQQTPVYDAPENNYQQTNEDQSYGHSQPSRNSYPYPTENGYTQPPDNGYPQPSENDYQQPSQNGYPHPSENGYPQPSENGYQQPSQNGYPQPSENGYPQPSENGYQQPTQNGYPQPSENGYPQPSENGYPQPSENEYLPPSEQGYPQPSGQGYPQTSANTYPPPSGNSYPENNQAPENNYNQEQTNQYQPQPSENQYADNNGNQSTDNTDTSIKCVDDSECPPNAVCSASEGSGEWEGKHCVCPEGYVGDSYECIERTDPNCACGLNAHCINIREYEHICVCDAGFRGDGYACRPNFSCKNNSDCEANAECKPAIGTNENICRCIQGFVKDQSDACIPDAQLCNGAWCAEHSSCLYDPEIQLNYCQCDEGYTGDGISQCVPAGHTCDVTNDCSLDAICTAVDNSYACVCKEGFTGDGYNCVPEATCRNNPNMCDPHASCLKRNDDYVCECNSGYNGNGDKCELNPRQAGNFLVASDGASIYRVPFQVTPRDFATPFNSGVSQIAVGIDVDCAAGRIYWGDVVSLAIKTAAYDGSNYDLFLSDGVKSPEGIAVDWSARNIFWTDSKKLTIEVANIDTKARKVLFAVDKISNPRGIAVHPHRGKIFWSDWKRTSPKIEWANMDGSQRGIFLDQTDVTLPNSLAIDWARERLCYADAGLNSIKCVGIDTKEKETIATNCSYPFGLTISGNRFYWTDWRTLKIEFVDVGTHERGQVPIHTASRRLYGVAVAPDQCPPANSICMFRNGNCGADQLCLPDGNRGRTCVDADKTLSRR